MRGLKVRVADAIARRRLWAPGDRVAVAVSGGRDSVCLLDLLVATAGQHGGRLSVVTVDHGARPDSAVDADHAVALAEGYGLAAVRRRFELGAGASEDTLRRARHAAFDALDVDVIALGHHRRDQAETALLGWLRGGGTRAMAGMAPRAGRLARPLLDVGPEELAAWAEARGLAWREDPSNADPRFLRNRVRAELLPLLEALRPGAERALARGAGHAAEDDRLLEALSIEAEAGASGRWPRALIADGPEPLVRRMLLRALPDLDSGRVDAILAAARRGRGVVAVSKGACVVVARGHVRVLPTRA